MRTAASCDWQAYNTGPDKDVLIGARFQAFYACDKGTDLGVKSWPPDAWKIGGGNVWGWITYDAELDALYHGTGNPGPWNAEQRPGDNKWTTGIFRARSGHRRRALVLPDLAPRRARLRRHQRADPARHALRRHMHKVLIHLDRNGYVYVIDRTDGQVLSADPFGPVNSSKGVDLKTGRPIVNPDKETKVGETVA